MSTDSRRPRPRHRRHDLRLVRGPDREAAQPARRRRRHGQLRHRAGHGHLRRRRQRRRPRRRRSRRPATPPRVPAAGRPDQHDGRRPTTPSRRPDADRRPAPAADRRRRARPSRWCALAMVPALQFDDWQWLSLALAAPVVMWGALAVPPGRVDEPAPRRRHHGHAHLGRHARRLRLVAVRPVLRRRRRARHDAWRSRSRPERGMGVEPDLPRGRRRRHRVHPRRPLLRGPGQAPLRRRAARPARARRQGRRRPPRRRRGPHPDRASSPSATASSSARARRSPPTASSRTGTSAIDASLLTGEPVPVEVGPGDAVTGATVNAGGRLVVRATRVGADTALAQIARLVDRRPDRQGRRCSASPTGSRPCSCPSSSPSPSPRSASGSAPAPPAADARSPPPSPC